MYVLQQVGDEILVVRPDGTVLYRLDATRIDDRAHAEQIVENLNYAWAGSPRSDS